MARVDWGVFSPGPYFAIEYEIRYVDSYWTAPGSDLMKWPFGSKSQKRAELNSAESMPVASEAASRTCASLDEIVEMNPYEFEWFVLSTLQQMGYRDLALTPHSGDLGIDIVGRNRRGKTTVVQCKRYVPGAKVTSPMLMTFIGMAKVHHKADSCIYVTTGGYTRDAVSLASQHRIELIDGPALAGIHCRQTKPPEPRRGLRGLRR